MGGLWFEVEVLGFVLEFYNVDSIVYSFRVSIREKGGGEGESKRAKSETSKKEGRISGLECRVLKDRK